MAERSDKVWSMIAVSYPLRGSSTFDHSEGVVTLSLNQYHIGEWNTVMMCPPWTAPRSAPALSGGPESELPTHVDRDDLTALAVPPAQQLAASR